MLNRVRLVALAVLLLTSAAQAQDAAPAADTLLDQIIARGVLRVGSTGDYKPFTFLNPETRAFEGISSTNGCARP
jgi:cyclohexadienyl dehydratase